MISLLTGIFSAARGRAWLALAITVAVGLTEGLTIVLLLPLLRLAGVEIQGSMQRISDSLAAAFRAAGIPPTLIAVLLVYVGLTIVHASLLRAKFIVDTLAVHQYTLALRSRLYSA